VIGGLVSPKRSEDAERDPDDRSDEDRIERELGGGRDELAQIVADRLVGQ